MPEFGVIFNRDNGTVTISGADIVNSTFLTARDGRVSPVSFTISNSILRNVNRANVADGALNLQFQSNCPARIPIANPRFAFPYLANNGGPTPTVALLRNSPAIDAIKLPDCVDQQGHPVTTDQRGFKRPFGPGCDIGAYEFSRSGFPPFWFGGRGLGEWFHRGRGDRLRER